jgi:type VI secretion system protein ImpC
MEFELRFGKRRASPAPKRRSDDPMRILVMGDFSGRHDPGVAGQAAGLSGRAVLKVDADNFDEVMTRLSPRLRLELDDAELTPLEIGFGRMDDFHPDQLYRNLVIFKAMRDIRSRLLDPATAGPVAALLKREPAEDDGATLERLLGRLPAAREAPGVDITQFLRRIVGPHIVPSGDPRLPDLLAAVDEAASSRMRVILHDPVFQGLESAWRSLWWLVTGIETGENLELGILDVTRQELEDDLRAAGADLEATGLFRLVVGRVAGDRPGPMWSCLVGHYEFGAAHRDFEVLGALGAVAQGAGAPFLAAASPRIMGCRSIAETPDPEGWTGADRADALAWQELRRNPVAGWLGLALPRPLLRLPYGTKTDPAECFAFEEMPLAPNHAAYLWGNPAFACALLLARSFLERGWSMEPGDHLEVGDLPAHTYQAAGEHRMTPCAEVFLTERAADAVLGHGVMPLLSLRDSNAARLLRFQSVADPPAALSGPWA